MWVLFHVDFGGDGELRQLISFQLRERFVAVELDCGRGDRFSGHGFDHDVLAFVVYAAKQYGAALDLLGAVRDLVTFFLCEGF